jgi:hypothetical protein
MREYCISAGGITVAGSTTLVFVNNTVTVPAVNLEYLRYWVGQSANATSNQQRIQLVTQVTVWPTVTGATPSKLKFQDSVSTIVSGTSGTSGTAGINASAEGAGSKTAVLDDAFNVLNGWLMVPTPAETRIMPAGATAGQGLFFPVAPTVLTNWAFGVHFREV